MHVDNMLALADRIEQNPEVYNQKHWCGFAYCIAGHAVVLSGWELADNLYDDIIKGPESSHSAIEARKFLDLDEAESDELFRACWKPPERVSVPEQLRRYARGEDQILLRAGAS